MSPTTVCQTPLAVRIGTDRGILQAIAQPDTELVLWQRQTAPAWATWIEQLSVHELPTCHLEMAPHQLNAAVQASCDASGTPSGRSQEALIADIAHLSAAFAAILRTPTVRLRLAVVTNNACRRWHLDCVPLRLICTYRGPGTQWVPPAFGAAVLACADDETSHALPLRTGDVALFKGCGWPGQTHDGGIVHRSPRIAGTGLARLVLVLNPPWVST